MDKDTRAALEDLAEEMNENETAEEEAAEEEAEAEEAAEDAAEEETEAEEAAQEERVDYTPRLDEYDTKLAALADTLDEIVRMVSSIVLAGGGNVADEEAKEAAQDMPIDEEEYITLDQMEQMFTPETEDKEL